MPLLLLFIILLFLLFYLTLIMVLIEHNKLKLYQFNHIANQWKEIGGGTVKLLKHKVIDKVRLLMRQSKIVKISVNHPNLDFLSLPHLYLIFLILILQFFRFSIVAVLLRC